MGAARGRGVGAGESALGSFPARGACLCAWPGAAARGWLRGSGRSYWGAGAVAHPGEYPAFVACCPLWSFPLDRGRTGGRFQYPKWEVERCLTKDQPRGEERGGPAVLGRKGTMAGTGQAGVWL